MATIEASHGWHHSHQETRYFLPNHVRFVNKRAYLESHDRLFFRATIGHAVISGNQHPSILADEWQPSRVFSMRAIETCVESILDLLSIECSPDFKASRCSIQVTRKLSRPLYRFPTRPLPGFPILGGHSFLQVQQHCPQRYNVQPTPNSKCHYPSKWDDQMRP